MSDAPLTTPLAEVDFANTSDKYSSVVLGTVTLFTTFVVLVAILTPLILASVELFKLVWLK